LKKWLEGKNLAIRGLEAVKQFNEFNKKERIVLIFE
jgi:hypothetical protein